MLVLKMGLRTKGKSNFLLSWISERSTLNPMFIPGWKSQVTTHCPIINKAAYSSKSSVSFVFSFSHPAFKWKAVERLQEKSTGISSSIQCYRSLTLPLGYPKDLNFLIKTGVWDRQPEGIKYVNFTTRSRSASWGAFSVIFLK